MKSTDMTAIAYPSWENGGSVWYSACDVNLYNLTDTDIANPVITFIVDSSQTLSSYSNFSFQQSGNVITGNLTDNNVIPAGGSVMFTVGVSNNTGTSIGNLPSQFTVNGEDADPPADSEAPSVPAGLVATSVGAQTISLGWQPSTDNVMVGGYHVQYSATGYAPQTVQVSTNSINLSGLSPETVWNVAVSAYDLSGNSSGWSDTLQVKTSAALPDPGPCTISAAPFVNYTAWPTPQCSQFSQGSGVKNYVLGFLTSGVVEGSGARPCWGGFPSISDSNYPDDTYTGDATVSDYGKNDIAALRAAGGDVAISFGGQAGQMIEETVTDIPALVAMYAGVIDNYQLTMIDLDVEGATLQLPDVLQRHVAVISQVQTQYPQLKISYTLPVDGQTDEASRGLTNFGLAFLQQLADAGVSPSLINGMTMDFGATTPPPDMYTGCVYALNALHDQIASVYAKWDSAQIWRRMGATPMFGINDNGTDFTPDNQQQLLGFAQENNLGCLMGWDATRDFNQGQAMCQTSEHNSISTCTYEGTEPYIYSKIIAAYQHR